MPTLERALARLRWLEAESAALKSHDPLAEMWAALEEYQPQADKDGHGESWRIMCEERTKESARDAADAAFAVAVPAKDKLAHVAALEAGFSARNAAWAASYAVREAAQMSATAAIAAIRRAKEGTR
jgi:hypothetical protein